jgi:hypothetical protein
MRAIPFSLEKLLTSNKRIPEYKVYAYNPTIDSYTKIITDIGNTTPLDITDYCSEITWTTSQLDFVLKDVTGNFNPDTGIYSNYLGDGCIIRLKEGDIRLPESEWVWTFTGAIRGQLGWVKNRKSRILEAKVSVYSRENTPAFKRRKMTSPEYSVGTDMGIMFSDIATKMGLSTNEVRVPGIFGRYFYHKTNQLSQVAPWEGLTSLLEVMMEIPTFDGEGKLNSYKKDLNRAPDIIFKDESYVYSYEVIARTEDAINKVIVTFLDSEMNKVPGPYQKLGDASVTTGFFTMDEKLDCYWSEDRKQRAEDTNMKIIKGVNDSLLPVGSEDYEELDLFHGRITVEISVWVPILATVMLLGYLAAAFIPDEVTVFGFGVSAGITISLGRVIQATCMMAILLIMMCLGSAQYEIWGTPYDLAYLEKRSIAIVNGIQYYEENEIDIKNDFIGTHDLSDSIAACELCYQVSMSCPRKLLIDDHLGLEIGDIIQIYDGRKIFIQSMKKTIKRGINPVIEITGFKVRTY